jgi:hypothetical protein
MKALFRYFPGRFTSALLQKLSQVVIPVQAGTQRMDACTGRHDRSDDCFGNDEISLRGFYRCKNHTDIL